MSCEHLSWANPPCYSQARAVVRVVAVDGDGQVHFAILPGSVAKNRHLLDRTVA